MDIRVIGIKTEEIEITEGLKKVVSYKIPDVIVCPKDHNRVAYFSKRYGKYRCEDKNCNFSMTSEEYIKYELEKSIEN